MFRYLLAAILPLMGAGTMLADAPAPAKAERKIEFGAEETKGVCGTVLAVTKDSILLAPTGNGPVTLPAHDCLAAGKVHKLVGHPCSYLLSDLKPGDIVALDTYVENKQTYCVAIQIFERPGGLVPPGQIVNKKKPYHEVRNADIAFRDKGTPIPEHLKPKMPALLPTPDKPKK